ncbi:MAG TPA: phosphatase PAP2 family protein [Mycobacteriales bacterium]|nr:phosphatase PAP2 family protein [Mycobacteriales bacterium]
MEDHGGIVTAECMERPGEELPARRSAEQASADGRGAAAVEVLRRHSRAITALRGFREIVLISGVYLLYDLTRYLVKGHQAEAFSHAARLLHLEAVLDLDPESWLNHIVSAHMVIGLASDYIYATLHYIVTPVVLIWLWRRHSASYSSARTVLMVATIIGLVGFSLLPVAPPRMLPGFVDTMARFSHYGWWGNAASAPRGLGVDTNQFAAMPSLHVGWALWCGWQMVRHGRHLTTKVLGVLYPVVLSLDVVATANHYLMDVVAGVVVVVLAAALVWLMRFTWRRLEPHLPLHRFRLAG